MCILLRCEILWGLRFKTLWVFFKCPASLWLGKWAMGEWNLVLMWLPEGQFHYPMKLLVRSFKASKPSNWTFKWHYVFLNLTGIFVKTPVKFHNSTTKIMQLFRSHKILLMTYLIFQTSWVLVNISPQLPTVLAGWSAAGAVSTLRVLLMKSLILNGTKIYCICILYHSTMLKWLKTADVCPNRCQGPGVCINIKTSSYQYRIPIIKIRQSHDCLIFIMQIPIPGKMVFILRWSALLALCEGNSLVTGEFPAQRASKAEKAPIWWCHHDVKNS